VRAVMDENYLQSHALISALAGGHLFDAFKYEAVSVVASASTRSEVSRQLQRQPQTFRARREKVEAQ